MTDAPTLATIGPTPYRFRINWYRVTQRWRVFCDWLKWIGHEPGNLETHARRELELAGWFKDDGFYGAIMGNAVLAMIRQFSDEGHSGMSAPLAISLFEKVAHFEPLTPLTGADDEWNDLGDGWFQNRRCSRVFKGGERFKGQAYDGEAIIWRDPDGSCFTKRDSQQPITFPYTPKREYRDRPSEGAP